MEAAVKINLQIELQNDQTLIELVKSIKGAFSTIPTVIVQAAEKEEEEVPEPAKEEAENEAKPKKRGPYKKRTEISEPKEIKDRGKLRACWEAGRNIPWLMAEFSTDREHVQNALIEEGLLSSDV